MNRLEIKTTTEIFQAHRKVMTPETPQPMNIYLDSAKKKWVSKDSMYKDVKEIYSRLDKVMTTNEHKTSSAFNQNELGKLKRTVINIMKELEEKNE